MNQFAWRLILCSLLSTASHAMEQPPLNEGITDDAVLRFILTNNCYSLERKCHYITDIFTWQHSSPHECNLQTGTLDVLDSIYNAYYPWHDNSLPPKHTTETSHYTYRLRKYGEGLPAYFSQGSLVHAIFAYKEHNSSREHALRIALELGADINTLSGLTIGYRKTLLACEMLYNPDEPGMHAHRIKLLLNLGAEVVVGESNALIEAVQHANPHALSVLLRNAKSEITTDNLKKAHKESQIFLRRYGIDDTTRFRTAGDYEADKKMHARQTEVLSQLTSALQEQGWHTDSEEVRSSICPAQ